MKKDKNKSTKSVITDLETQVDRFDLEQQILQCWNMVDDVKLFADQGASGNEFSALATVYHRKFETLFDTFEIMLRTGQITNSGSK
jgi:hypothetical protein